MKPRKKYALFTACLVITMSLHAQTPGCTDPMADNFDPSATVNDGSCTYFPVSVTPKDTEKLDPVLSETSGLVFWNGYLWTHNDNSDTRLYGIEPNTAGIASEYLLEGVENVDWEEIAQDDGYLYIGDFGNNSAGNRTDLHILRIEKQSLISGSPSIDTIWFSYEDQSDLGPSEPNQTDFDCEAFIVSTDSIYLFTKQWLSAGTTVYALPKMPGTYSATPGYRYYIQGLVTGATWLEPERLLVLCGYTSLLSPIFWLLYDYEGMNFFSGNRRRVTVSLPFHQIEGIATRDGVSYYCTNESFILQPLASNPQKFHLFDLGELLGGFLNNAHLVQPHGHHGDRINVYPNPFEDMITLGLEASMEGRLYEIYDGTGRCVLHGEMQDPGMTIDTRSLTSGIYLVRIGEGTKKVIRVIKR